MLASNDLQMRCKDCLEESSLQSQGIPQHTYSPGRSVLSRGPLEIRIIVVLRLARWVLDDVGRTVLTLAVFIYLWQSLHGLTFCCVVRSKRLDQLMQMSDQVLVGPFRRRRCRPLPQPGSAMTRIRLFHKFLGPRPWVVSIRMERPICVRMISV